MYIYCVLWGLKMHSAGVFVPLVGIEGWKISCMVRYCMVGMIWEILMHIHPEILGSCVLTLTHRFLFYNCSLFISGYSKY